KLKFTPENKGVDWLIYSIGAEKNLVDFLKDDELFKAYPHLQDIKIKTFTYQESADSPSVVGRYEQDEKTIKLNAENIDTDMKKAKSFLYHEIQHAIQDIEGFAYGERLEQISKDNYRLRHGEVEARNVQKRMSGRGKPYTKESAKRGLEIVEASIEDIKKHIHDIQNSIGEYKNTTQEDKDFFLEHFRDELQKALRDKERVLHFINDEIYNRTPHPYETMDTPLKDTIAQASMQGEALSKELESKTLDLKISKEKDFFKNLRNKAKNILKNLKGKVVENENNALKASISSEGINKMISVKAVDKSIKNGFSKEEHFISVENVLNLFKISQFVRSEKANNGSADIINYHKFNADFSINKKPTRAKITIKESYEGGNKIYSLELLELQRASK
ncbi:hypothetical protein ACK8U2_001627, partial [Campylobacter upsaliensis]